jgi:2,3-bisphosphoglycerate-independent phosphoglycerate mutase
MKYLVLLGDGMADYPLRELGGKTPLQVAAKPNMDRLAKEGVLGLVRTVPPGLPPGSDVANLAVLGYDPQRYYTGRSPLEAAGMGVELGAEDVTFRCNLVTLSDEAKYEEKKMVDYSAGEISSEEAALLIKDLAAEFNSETKTLYPGVSYRHLLVWRNGPLRAELTPPHDISDRVIGPYLPQGEGAGELLSLLKESQRILAKHPVNQERIARNLAPANSIWLWGQGTKPQLPLFFEKYRLRGVVISAVDLAKGLGACAGLQVIEVPGVTGNIHTNFTGKAEAALSAFRAGVDFVYLHIEAADEAGHHGEVETKIAAIERIDHEVLGRLLRELPAITPEYKILLLPDHPTPLSVKTHVADPVPFVIYSSKSEQPGGSLPFDEESAARTGLFIEPGHSLMDRFLLG